MKKYWITWLALLSLTLMMLWLDSAPLARGLFVTAMVAAMLTKASLIAANFMHLRFEHRALVFTIVVGLLVTGAVLYMLIVPDAHRIHHMLQETPL